MIISNHCLQVSTTEYEYYNALMQRQGCGYFGFENITTKNALSKIKIKTYNSIQKLDNLSSSTPKQVYLAKNYSIQINQLLTNKLFATSHTSNYYKYTLNNTIITVVDFVHEINYYKGTYTLKTNTLLDLWNNPLHIVSEVGIGYNGNYIQKDETDIIYNTIGTNSCTVPTLPMSTTETKSRTEFDAWGRNRNTIDWTYIGITTNPMYLYRGYTGHEHMPEFALINMNGRIYDPVLGRMLSPDINIADAGSTQAFNRYSYANNNPLKYTDPSGNIPLLVVAGVLVGMWLGGAVGNMANADGALELNPGHWEFNAYTIGGMVIGGALGGYAGHLAVIGKLSIVFGANFSGTAIASFTISNTATGLTRFSFGGLLALAGAKDFSVSNNYNSSSQREVELMNHIGEDVALNAYSEQASINYKKNTYLAMLTSAGPATACNSCNYYDNDGDKEKIVGGVNIGFGGVETSAGISRVGTNLTVYKATARGRVFYGNQYVKTFGIKMIGTIGGWTTFGLLTYFDYKAYKSGEISGGKFALNSGVGLYSMILGGYQAF